MPDTSKTWMDMMFREHADLFLKVSERRTDLDAAVAFLKSITPRPPERIVDLACGGGRLTVAMAAWGGHVTGVDMSDEFLAYAWARAAGLANVEFRKGDMLTDQIYEELGDVDLITRLYTSLGYFNERQEERFIRNCLKRLKNNGVLVLDSINHASFLSNPYQETKSDYGDLKLHEYYSRNESHDSIDCAWVYKRPEAEVVIPFSLGKMDINRIRGIFNEERTDLRIFSGFDGAEHASPPGDSTRVTLVGIKT
ncbi:class I SAM-dependent methyltransferase [Brevundimonas sp.]|uniref:class I SAM-dependent methyltransferase n=1 Tax=Brevundimonas sp. TaxID=1871086 RepID=UPI001DFE4FD0|nr:class I SAM-dependent methyltransferase [Brevundimonas sp.]MBL0946593.1 class I SAM-dependent methyltransferase [Brevundimonas sp.]